jgi:hypothetical protein
LSAARERRAGLAALARATVAMIAVTGAALGAASSPGAASSAATTRVSYLAGGSVYLAAGRLEGLAEGDTLQAVSRGKVVAFLIVRYLSSHRAACDTLKAVALPAVGDEVWYQARTPSPAPPPEGLGAEPAPAAADTTGIVGAPDSTAESGGARLVVAPPVARSAVHRVGRLRGRIGARYLVVDPGAGAGYSQPALDLKLDGANLGGMPLDVGVDVRSRRTYHGAPGVADDGEARVYRMSATYHDGPGHRRLTIGRQLSPSLAAVNLFDGALIEYAGQRWSGGLFSGAQPHPLNWALSSDVIQHGGFVGLRGRQGARRWSATTGGIASFDHGQVNRQFAFVAGSYLDPRLSLSVAEELDLSTGWKRAIGEPTLSLTSSFMTARAQLTRTASLNAGFDNRRNVRLYRDRLTPETEFDDRYRQGAWVGSSLDLLGHLRVGADGRWSSGGTGGDYRSWSVNSDASRLPWLQADLHWRTTHFRSTTAHGWLHAAGLAVRPWGQNRLELSGGQRTSDDGVALIRTRLSWEGADLDVGLAGHWYLLLSAEHDHGDGSHAVQGYASLSWLF